MDNCTVVFKTESGDISVSAPRHSSLLEQVQLANLAIDAPCGGNGSCGKCRVRLLDGDLAFEDAPSLQPEDLAEGWRLACKSTITADCTVELPSAAAAWQRGLKVDDEVREDDPAWQSLVQLLKAEGLWSNGGGEVLEITLEPPTTDDNTPDAERLSSALALATGADNVQVPLALLRTLPELLREESFALRCLLTRNELHSDAQAANEQEVRLVDLQPLSSREVPCALACDIGTTGVSVQLVNLVDGLALAQASAGNAQIRYGADVINRIMQQAKPGGVERLKHAIVAETLNPLISAVCAQAQVATTCIARVVFTGNTTMSHLLLGVQADSLRMEPYVPCFGNAGALSAGELGIAISPFAPVYLAPNVGSYVGGDITAGILASGLWNSDEMQLFIDLGTNGELVFGNNEFMMTCACSAGPAFEGGGIRSGMRASRGAIEAATIDRTTLEPNLTVIGGGKPAGICGSGLIDLISELFCSGALDGRGRFIASGERFTRDEHDMGSYTVAFAEETAEGKAIYLDEVDVDNFIRAKGAIFSAICVMLDATGFSLADLSRVLVAGGIGSGININNAIAIGLFPDIDRENYSYLGNTSLLGARAMAQSSAARQKVADLAAGMTYLELSSEPGYMDAFIAACFLPHTDASLFSSRH